MSVDVVDTLTFIMKYAEIVKNFVYPFLYFGYLPKLSQNFKNEPWATVEKRKFYHDNISNIKDLIELGQIRLKEIFKDIENGLHVVPLSGGLDSRAILGGLLEAGQKKNIIAVTFGTPGSLDFEIASHITKKIGLKHEKIDLTHIKINYEELQEALTTGMNWTPLFDGYYNRLICKYFGKNAIYWSGYMGDPLSGSRLPASESRSWNSALIKFSEKNKIIKSYQLTPSTYNPLQDLPQKPLFDRKLLSYDEQLDFAIRQLSYIKKVVIQTDYNFRIPFCQPKWVSFMLSIPRNYKIKQNLYKEILLKSFPYLFELPTKTNLGLNLRCHKWKYEICKKLLNMYNHHPVYIIKLLFKIITDISITKCTLCNYIDFDNAVRTDQHLKNIIRQLIISLKDREIITWLDINEIWTKHNSKTANHGMVLILLAALELNIRHEISQCEKK